MPFKSEAQRKWMYANEPERAKQWEAETPKDQKLPGRVGESKFVKHFTKAVEHNQANDKKKSFHITYKKMNGRTVKRKIDPFTIRGNLVLAYDHKRDATRSFKLDRVKSMEKAAKDYESKPRPIVDTAMGSLAGVGASMLLGLVGVEPSRSIKPAAAIGALLGLAKSQNDTNKLWNHYGNLYHKDKSNMEKAAFWNGFNKVASGDSALYHGVEMLGLGILAAPSAMHMAGMKAPSEKNYHRAEMAGLGILAAPSMVALAKKFKPMRGLINKLPAII